MSYVRVDADEDRYFLRGPACFSANGKWLFVATARPSVVRFDLNSEILTQDAKYGVTPARWSQPYADKLTALALSVAGDLLVATQLGWLWVWDTASSNNVHQVPMPGPAIRRIQFLPSGSCFIATGADGRCVLWDARSGKLVSELADGQATDEDIWFDETSGVAAIRRNRTSSLAIDVHPTTAALEQRLDALRQKLVRVPLG